jgi:hypothetical protein
MNLKLWNSANSQAKWKFSALLCSQKPANALHYEQP